MLISFLQANPEAAMFWGDRLVHFFAKMERVSRFQIILGIVFALVLMARYIYLHKKKNVEEPSPSTDSSEKKLLKKQKNKKSKKNKPSPPEKELSSLRRSTVLLRPKNRFDLLVAGIALFAVLSYYNFGNFHGGGTFIHIWDFFHYYMGSKYSKELGYSHLYDSIIAGETVDAENLQKNTEMNQELLKQEKDERKRKYLFERQKALSEHFNFLKKVEFQRQYIRDLESYKLKSASEVSANKEKYIQLFSPKRWEEFREDLWFFRTNVYPERWGQILRDHGYNPSPVWNTTGAFFANLGRAKNASHIRMLVLLDPILLVLAAIALYLSFGLRTLLFALIIFGISFPSRIYWNGGAFLRQGWLFCSILGICCLRKKKYTIAGIFFAYATMVRVFPLLFLAGPGMKALGYFLKKRSIPKRYWQLFLSFFFTCLLLVGYGCLSGLGPKSWILFLEKMKLHSKQNLTNNMGLKPILLYEGETTFQDIHSELIEDPLIRAFDPFLMWERFRQEKFDRLKIVYYGIFVFIFLLFSGMVQKKNDVEASVLGIILLFTGLSLTCYYYSMLLLFPLVLNRSNRIEKSLKNTVFLALLVLLQSFAFLMHYYFQDFFIAVYFSISLAIAIYLYSYLGFECFVLIRRYRKKKHDPQPI